ncbi:MULTISPECIES: signal peptidase I [unclassified Modestobacter]|uniref:signal peptidase I n=1 Tax=unclassified Modestobacter TaxID=2643866 RepID=UPI0022AA4B33|nr:MULTISPECIES: signal peptidase I [unclassified Modestobacter]MCZ2810062.1 signal peptidase I [Modestobacter sp. VKM Ac-2979]MCZ2844693.1 signal peptidase I [Modestobacter sp. VKM Ac-2980]MCZ2847142.1 signal peptidase I [Modestobacter sp. VKM Ac-2978]
MTTALLARPALLTDTATARRPAQQSTRPGRAAGLGKRVAGLTFRWSLRLLVTVAVLAFGLLAVGPHVLDYRTMTMLTASMSPAIDPGDVTIVTPLPVSEVTEGMIIAYHIPIDDHHLVSHRVVSVEHGADGAVTVETKGDANEAVDPWQAVLQGDTAYQVRAVVPELGHAIQALRTPVVSQALVYGAPALLAGWLLLSIWRPATEVRQDDEIEVQP